MRGQGGEEEGGGNNFLQERILGLGCDCIGWGGGYDALEYPCIFLHKKRLYITFFLDL